MKTEQEIINGCLKRKRKAQKILFEKYHASLMGICLRYAKNKSEAEDILLIGFTRIFQKIESYSAAGSFEGWLRRIVINVAIDNFRKNKKNYYFETLEESSYSSEYADYVPDTFAIEDILKTIQSLPNGYRMVFNLYAIEGYSHKEIAEMLGFSESTSKTQYLKARKKLQSMLAEYNYQKPESKPKTNGSRVNFFIPIIKTDD
ncbi:MAG TPA: RNA polymerase sigma factor [Bacteroidales bacterium]